MEAAGLFLGAIPIVLKALDTSYTLIYHHRQLRPRLHDTNIRLARYGFYEGLKTNLEHVIGQIDWLSKSGQTARRGDSAIVAEIPLKEIEPLYRDVVSVMSDLSALFEESPIHSPLQAIWWVPRLQTRKENIMARLKDLSERLEKLQARIQSQGNELIEQFRASLPTIPLDEFARAAIEALLDQKFLLPAAQLLSTARLHDIQTGGPSIPNTTSEGVAMLQTNEAVCDLLQYEAMSNRASTIAEASADSCKWVFDENRGSSIKLYEWLEHGQGLYFIAGKEGSGKSTLMKYILNEPRTMELLESWSLSGTSPLVTGAYFFWRSGTQLQRSEEGLLRSLIYSILKQKPEFTPRILPREWAKIFESFLRGSNNLEPVTWEVKDLRAAFKSLFSLPLKLFFLVDGLDEYKDSEDKELTYIGMIRSLFEDPVATQNVKFLVSSRPLVVLEKFGISPNIHLHESNRDAINRYVRETLERDLIFKRAEKLDDINGRKVTEYLLDTAKGSFLWVTLAVKTIQTQLLEGSTLEQIHQELSTRLPESMHAFYEQLWSNMSHHHQSEASEILQIVLAGRSLKSSPTDSDEALRLVDLALAIGDPMSAADTVMSPWSIERIRSDCRRVANGFTTAWPDFIKVNNKSDMISTSIEFCHRSVLEFLELEKTMEALEKSSPRSDFCPYTSHLKSAVQHLKILPKPLHKKPLPLLWAFVTSALVAANKVDSMNPVNFRPYESLLTVLDQTMTYHHGNICKDHGYETRHLESRMRDPTGAVEWRDRGRDYKRISKMHWSNFHFDRECSHPRDWEDSFLSLAVQFGLNNYVKRALEKNGSTQKVKKGRPLLNYALAPTPIAPNVSISPDIVTTLLNHGAKVNEKFEKKSCWENAVRWQYETYVEGGSTTTNGSNSEQRALAESRAKIFLILLEKGASTQVWVETSRGLEISAKDVIERSFKGLAPDSEPSYQALERYFR